MNETETFKEIWEEIQDLKIGEDNRTMIACCILKEIGKTQRTDKIEKRREDSGDKPTEKQLTLMNKLKIPFTENTTKMEASKLISEALNR